MGWRYHVLSAADVVARGGGLFSRKLPAYYAGHWLWLSKQCWRSLYSQYEPYMSEAIAGNLARGGSFWDVGANIGWFSLYAAKIVGARGSVVSFEPAPKVFALLWGNVAGVGNISIYQWGIGNAEGEMSFAAQGTSSSASFVAAVTELTRDRNPGQPVHNISVTMRKIDSLLGKLRAPDLVKIDVEGYELEVLKGAERLLWEVRPALVIEVHPHQMTVSGGSETALFALLQRHRYGWSVIDRNPNSLYSILAKPEANDCWCAESGPL